VQCSCN